MGSVRRCPPVVLTLVIAATVAFGLTDGSAGGKTHPGRENGVPSWDSGGWAGQQAMLTSRLENELLGAATVSGAARITDRTGGASHVLAATRGCCVRSHRDDRPPTATTSGPVRLRSPPG